MKIIKLGLLVLILNTKAMAGGDSVGNGGDGISQVFEDARIKAIKLLERLDPCNIPVTTKPEVKEWLLNYRLELVDDVRNSHHIWQPTNLTGTCAWTRGRGSREIVFSTQECREKIYSVETAVALLIHESAHHFGKYAETFAIEAGNAVRHSETNRTCHYDPFQSNSCNIVPVKDSATAKAEPGRLTTRYASMDIGEWRLFSRVRTCKVNGSCSAWSYDDNPKRTFYDINDREYALPASGRVIFSIEAPKNDIYLKTFGARACQLTSNISYCDFGMGPTEESDLYE